MQDEDQDLKCRLSMLVDAELNIRDNPELIDTLEQDPVLSSAWERYHLIGEVMRKPASILVDSKFATQVSTSIKNEPALLIPARRQTKLELLRHRIGTVALAASLAGIAILIGDSIMQHRHELDRLAQAPQPLPKVEGRGYDESESPADMQFDDYLLTHNETAFMVGSAGMLPNVRLVSVRNER